MNCADKGENDQTLKFSLLDEFMGEETMEMNTSPQIVPQSISRSSNLPIPILSYQKHNESFKIKPGNLDSILPIHPKKGIKIRVSLPKRSKRTVPLLLIYL